MIHNPDPPKSTPPGAGHSSFELIDAPKFFAELNLAPGVTLADLGCGEGHYTFALADVMGAKGLIYALDLWQPGIQALTQRAAAEGRHNIKAMVVNISRRLPLQDESVDVALMATVLHDLLEFDLADGALKEAARVVRPKGTLAIVALKKIEGPPGPPLRIRLTPEEVEKVVTSYGFAKTRVAEVGPYNYLILFTKETAL
jgi:ubiquinone/menaquinone biosynthesis C-methylase UbiE